MWACIINLRYLRVRGKSRNGKKAAEFICKFRRKRPNRSLCFRKSSFNFYYYCQCFIVVIIRSSVALYNEQRTGYFGRDCKNRLCDAVGVYCEAAFREIIALPYDDESEDMLIRALCSNEAFAKSQNLGDIFARTLFRISNGGGFVSSNFQNFCAHFVIQSRCFWGFCLEMYNWQKWWNHSKILFTQSRCLGLSILFVMSKVTAFVNWMGNLSVLIGLVYTTEKEV